MTARLWIVALAVALVLAAAAVVVVRGVTNAPLRQTGTRTCIGCVETHWNGTSRLRGSRVSGGYAFREGARYRISFSEGSVVVAGERLTPGCHEGVGREGQEIRLDDVRELRLVVPAAPGSCAGDAG